MAAYFLLYSRLTSMLDHLQGMQRRAQPLGLWTVSTVSAGNDEEHTEHHHHHQKHREENSVAGAILLHNAPSPPHLAPLSPALHRPQ